MEMRPDKYLHCILKLKGYLSLGEREGVRGGPEYGMQLARPYPTPVAYYKITTKTTRKFSKFCIKM